jgi:peptidoglycan/xylan/chitin deacetylase (PgdA/CDA1 family)
MIMLLSILAVLFTPLYIVYKPPSLLISYFARKWPDVLWHVGTSAKIVALTIDDAPSAHTREIMQILKDNEVHATFFVIGGQVPGREDVLRDLVAAGHELGNHAMHDEPSVSLPDAELTQQIDTVESYINTAYDSAGKSTYPPRYFRPGSGFFSLRMRALVNKLQYKIVLGSIYPHDAQIAYAGVNARHVLSMLRPGGIIICHDRRPWTIPMLKRVLPEIKRRGYRITTVSGLVGEGGVT